MIEEEKQCKTIARREKERYHPHQPSNNANYQFADGSDKQLSIVGLSFVRRVPQSLDLLSDEHCTRSITPNDRRKHC